MGKKSGSQTASTTSAPPPEVMAQYRHVMDLANNQAGQPLEQYTGPRIADLSGNQMQAIGDAAAKQGTAIPYYDQAAQSFTNAQKSLLPGGVQMSSLDNPGGGYSFSPMGGGKTAGSTLPMGGGKTAGSSLMGSQGQPSGMSRLLDTGYASLGDLANTKTYVPSFSGAQGAADDIRGAGEGAFSSALSLAGALPGAANSGVNTAMGGLNAAYLAAMGANPALTLNQSDLGAARGFSRDDVYGDLPQFNTSTIGQYQNPYQQDVINSTVANIDEENAQDQQRLMGQAIMSGASPFGGDRAGIAAAELARKQALAKNATIAGLNQQGYAQAVDQYNRDKSLQAQTRLSQNQQASTAALSLADLQQRAGLSAAQLGVNAGDLGVRAGLGAGDLNQKGVAQAGQLTATVGNLQQQGAIAQADAMRQASSAEAEAAARARGIDLSGSQAAAGLGFNQFNQQQQNQLAKQQLQLSANQGQAGLALNAGQGMMGLGQAAQQSNLLDLNSLLSTGALSQQQAQNLLSVPYQDFLQQQAFPYENLSWLSGISTGLGSGMGGTSTTTTPTAGWGQQAAGLATAALPFFMKRGGRIPGLAAGHHRAGGVGSYALGGWDEEDEDDSEYDADDSIPEAPPSAYEDPVEVIGGAEDDTPAPPAEGGFASAMMGRPRAGFQSHIDEPTKPTGKPDWKEAVTMAGLGMAASRSPQFGQALAEGAQAGMKNWGGQKALQRQSEQDYRKAQTDKQRADSESERYYNLDQKPQVDHSGDTVRFIYNDGHVIDTGIPTVASRRQKSDEQYRKDSLADRSAERGERRADRRDDRAQRAADRSADRDQGRYTWQPAEMPDPADPTKKVTGSMRYPTRGDEEPKFFPGMVMTGKGGSGGGKGQTERLADQLITDGLATDRLDALAKIRDPNNRVQSQIDVRREAMAASDAKADVGSYYKDPIATMNKHREGYGLKPLGAMPETNKAPPLPPKDKLVKGQTYQTKRGPGKWTGDHFELVGP